ncbi:MAG: hypothetical protein WBM40_07530, partial [Thiohalocapsa sp.]
DDTSDRDFKSLPRLRGAVRSRGEAAQGLMVCLPEVEAFPVLSSGFLAQKPSAGKSEKDNRGASIKTCQSCNTDLAYGV